VLLPRFTVISNVDAKPYTDVEQIKTNLRPLGHRRGAVARHRPSRWSRLGLDLIVEFGASPVLRADVQADRGAHPRRSPVSRSGRPSSSCARSSPAPTRAISCASDDRQSRRHNRRQPRDRPRDRDRSRRAPVPASRCSVRATSSPLAETQAACRTRTPALR